MHKDKNSYLEIGDFISQVYNINTGILTYQNCYRDFVREVGYPDLFPELIKHCASAASARGVPLDVLTRLAIEIIGVLVDHNIKPDIQIVYFIHRMLVFNKEKMQ